MNKKQYINNRSYRMGYDSGFDDGYDNGKFNAQKEIDSLKARANKADKKADKLLKVNEELSEINQEQHDLIEEQIDTNKELLQINKDLLAVNEEQEFEINSQKGQILGLKSEISGINNDIHKLEVKINNNTSEIENHEEAKELLKTENNEIDIILNEYVNLSAVKSDYVKQILIDSDNRKANNNKQIVLHNNRISELKAENGRIKTKINNIKVKNIDVILNAVNNLTA